MSITYHAICIIDLLEPNGRVEILFAEQLLAEGIKINEPVMIPHWPKPQEIVNAIVQVKRYSVSADQVFEGDDYTVYIDIDGSQAGLPQWGMRLEVEGTVLKGDPDTKRPRWEQQIGRPRSFEMHKWPEEDVIDVSRQLALLCGPLLVVNDFGIVALVETDGSVQESNRV